MSAVSENLLELDSAIVSGTIADDGVGHFCHQIHERLAASSGKSKVARPIATRNFESSLGTEFQGVCVEGEDVNLVSSQIRNEQIFS